MRAKENDYETLRKLFSQRRAVVPNFYGNFYPLTAHSTEKDSWIAWQFDRPEAGKGIAQVFRRPDSIFKAADIRLQGLDPNASYRVGCVGAESRETIPGRQLMTKGVSVSIPDQPGAAVIAYERLP